MLVFPRRAAIISANWTGLEARPAEDMKLTGMQDKIVVVGMLLALGLTNARGDGPTDRPPQGAPGSVASARPDGASGDLRLTIGSLLSETIAPGQSLLLCREGFEMIFGDHKLAAGQAVVWVEAGSSAGQGETSSCRVRVYLARGVSDSPFGDGSEDSLKEDSLKTVVLEPGKAMVVEADVRGEVLITANRKGETGDPRRLPLYEEAVAAFGKAGMGRPPEPIQPARVAVAKASRAEPTPGYTIRISPVTDTVPKYEQSTSKDGQEIITYIGRSHISWQDPNESDGQAGPIELEADCVVVWRGGSSAEKKGSSGAAVVEEPGVSAVYVSGDVLLTQGTHTIRATELYYDLRNRQALAKNVVMKSFDPARGIPIYLRAKVLRQVSSDTFEAEDVVLSSSEFWTPPLSVEAAKIHVVDKRQATEPNGVSSAGEFDVELRSVKFKVGNTPLLTLPKVHTDGQRPELPIRSIHVGNDSTYGTSIETRWWLDRLLGLRSPEGTDGALMLDYYSERGVGGGLDLSYERENYFGSVLGYIIEDHGEDRLSRTRKNIDVPEATRGRFHLLHRQFLPYSWQLTAEVGYVSDENFLEQFYRAESNVGKEQETLLYLKRIQDNWGLSFLGKVRINDFVDQVEELPTAEYHLVGQSLFNDRLTFFSDNQISRFRYRYGPYNPMDEPDEYFTFTGTRNELDLPLAAGPFKAVPFVAGTFGYEDGTGFQTELDDDTVESKDAIAIGEAGIRLSTRSFWCVYPNVESRLWDLHQLRHIISPSLTAVAYAASNEVAEQRDTLDFGISQRWQTKRGPVGRRRTVDWLSLDLDFVWVAESSDEVAGPDRFLWNEPFIPLVNREGDRIPSLDRRATGMFGPRRNYISADMALRLTDTTSILGDAYFGMQSGVFEQLDVGFSRLLWPNLTYYVGSRYLRNVENGLGEKGSTALTFAATYVLDSRYTAVVAEQFDFDYGSNVRTDVTLVRKYHRTNLALTFSVDDSLDEQRFVLSLWPEGVSELAIGLRRYMDLGASDVY